MKRFTFHVSLAGVEMTEVQHVVTIMGSQQEGGGEVSGSAGPVEMPEVHVDLIPQGLRVPSIVLATIGVLAVLLLAYLAYLLLPVVLLLFVSLLFATAIEPVVNWLRRGPFNRSAGILIVYTGLFLLIGVIGFLIIPVLLAQTSDLGSILPKKLDALREGVKEMPNGFIKQQATNFVDAAKYGISQFAQAPPPASGAEKVATATQTAFSVAEAFFSVVTLFVVAYYWLTERTLIKRAAMSWLPAKRANRVRRVWDDIEVKVGGWVRGQLTLMLIIGLASAVGYFVLGVKYWPVLALFIGITEAIPLVGPYIGTAPAVLIALTQSGNDGLPLLVGMDDFGSLTRALLVAAFAIVLQTVEGNVLVPRIMKNSVGISPLTVIVSLLTGAALAGLVGALLAVPIVGSLQVVISDFKAARESEEKLEAITEASQETRREEGDLVVAHPAPAGKQSTTEVQG